MPNTVLSKHKCNGDKCQHSLKCPLLARVKEFVFLVKCCGRGGKKNSQSYKKTLQKMQWEEAQMKFRFRMLKNDYFIQIS